MNWQSYHRMLTKCPSIVTIIMYISLTSYKATTDSYSTTTMRVIDPALISLHRAQHIQYMSSCKMSEAPDDEEVQKALNRPSTSSCEDQTHQASSMTATATTTTADLYRVGGFLIAPRTSIELLCDHSRVARRLKAKGCDRVWENAHFVARKQVRSQTVQD